jgi:hypothetical protein
MADPETSTPVSDESGPEADDPGPDRLDEQEDESFPASDPHSDWAGGPPDGGD